MTQEEYNRLTVGSVLKHCDVQGSYFVQAVIDGPEGKRRILVSNSIAIDEPNQWEIVDKPPRISPDGCDHLTGVSGDGYGIYQSQHPHKWCVDDLVFTFCPSCGAKI